MRRMPHCAGCDDAIWWGLRTRLAPDHTHLRLFFHRRCKNAYNQGVAKEKRTLVDLWARDCVGDERGRPMSKKQIKSKEVRIPEGQSRDPDYWAAAAELSNSSNEPEEVMDLRAMMTAVAMLHESYPNRDFFTDKEVVDYIVKALERYPALRELQ